MTPPPGRGPGHGAVLAAALALVLASCAPAGPSPEERLAAEARLRASSLQAAAVLARESLGPYRALGDAGFVSLAQATLASDGVLPPEARFRAARIVTYGPGVLVCGEVSPDGDGAWLRFAGGALPGFVWSEFSEDWITRAANAALIEACP